MTKTVIQVVPQNEPMKAVVLSKVKGASLYCRVIAWCIFVDEDDHRVVGKEPIVNVNSEHGSVWYEITPGNLWADGAGDEGWFASVVSICKTYGYSNPDE